MWRLEGHTETIDQFGHDAPSAAPSTSGLTAFLWTLAGWVFNGSPAGRRTISVCLLCSRNFAKQFTGTIGLTHHNTPVRRRLVWFPHERRRNPEWRSPNGFSKEKPLFYCCAPKSSDFPESFVSSLCQVPGTGLLYPLLKEASSANGARGRGLGHLYLSGPTILATLKYNHVHFFLFFNVKGFAADEERNRIIKLTEGDIIHILES